VVAWGDSTDGQTNVPAGLSGVTAIGAGGYHSLAVKNSGTVVAWGDDSSGQTDVPARLSGVIAVACGYWHSLALKSDGTVIAWGNNDYGQTDVPAGLSGVIAVAGGDWYSLALKSDGTVIAWGNDWYGQTDVPTGLSGVIAIAAGGYHGLALKNDGTVIAWGHNGYGQTNVPAGLSGVIAVAGGAYHSLALKNDGTVIGWGNNDHGQTDAPAGLSGVTTIAVSYDHSVALKSDGTVVAWGYNAYGQTNVPAGLSVVTAIAAGTYHTLALVAGNDSVPPTLTLPSKQTVAATSAAGATVTYAVTAVDNADPSPQVTCTPASGTVFPLGATTVACTATDAAGNTATGSFPVTVAYSWSGVLQPVNADGTSIFKSGRTVPVKFALTGASEPVTDAVATLSYAKITDGIEGTVVEAETNVAATTGNQFRYTGGQYLFNWSTKGLADGTYALKINLGDGVDRTVHVSLRA
jgi:hypothetical protein